MGIPLPVLLAERYLRILPPYTLKPQAAKPCLMPYLMISRLKEFPYSDSGTKMMPAQHAPKPVFPSPATALMKSLLGSSFAAESAMSPYSQSTRVESTDRRAKRDFIRGILRVCFVYRVLGLECIPSIMYHPSNIPHRKSSPSLPPKTPPPTSPSPPHHTTASPSDNPAPPPRPQSTRPEP